MANEITMPKSATGPCHSNSGCFHIFYGDGAVSSMMIHRILRRMDDPLSLSRSRHRSSHRRLTPSPSSASACKQCKVAYFHWSSCKSTIIILCSIALFCISNSYCCAFQNAIVRANSKKAIAKSSVATVSRTNSRSSSSMSSWPLYWLCGDSPFHNGYNDNNNNNEENGEEWKKKKLHPEAMAFRELVTMTSSDSTALSFHDSGDISRDEPDDDDGCSQKEQIRVADARETWEENDKENSCINEEKEGHVAMLEQMDDNHNNNEAVHDADTNDQHPTPTPRRLRYRVLLWSSLKNLHRKRRTRIVNRKLHRAHERFTKRHYYHQSSIGLQQQQSSLQFVKGLEVSKSVKNYDNEDAVTDDILSDDDNDSNDKDTIMTNTNTKYNNNTRYDDHDDSLLDFGQYNSHTRPTTSMESICHDQMPFAHGEIKKMPYVHGGFFGAAPFLLTNPHWTSILRQLMPDVYVQMSRRIANSNKQTPASRLIHWAENNPVVAAYGTAHEMEYSHTMPILEWDVFLDPKLVRRLERALRGKERFLNEYDEDGGTYHNKASHGASENVGEGMETPNDITQQQQQQQILANYDNEIKKQTTKLVEGMLIAHGNVVQIIAEQTGFFKRANFASVKRTCKTLGGGMFAREWLAVYSEAMRLGMDCTVGASVLDSTDEEANKTESSREVQADSSCDRSAGLPQSVLLMQGNDDCDDGMSTNEENSSIDEISTEQSEHSQRISTFQRMHLDGWSMPTPTFQNVDATSLHKAASYPNKSIPESISSLNAPFRLILDLKSRHISRRVWALVIDFLRDAGANIEGIASFNVSEMRDTAQYCRTPVNEIFFLHSAGDMQHMCHTGQIKRGDKVFFNAGSLFWDYRNADFVKSVLRRGSQPCFDRRGGNDEGYYRLKPHARIHKSLDKSSSNYEGSKNANLFARLFGDFFYDEAPDGEYSTIQEYKEYYQLSIGLYLQECAIDETTLNLIVKYVNSNLHVYDLGLSWGGINGLTVKGIEPSRFTVTDGLRSQRFVSVPWKKNLHPDSSKRLPPLGFVKKVLFH